MRFIPLILAALILIVACTNAPPVEIKTVPEDMSAFTEFEPFGLFSTRTISGNMLIDGIDADVNDEHNYEELFLELETWRGFAVNESMINCSSLANNYMCLYYYSFQNARKDLCRYLENNASLRECRPYGCKNITVNYEDMCITRATLMEPYIKSENKTAYCQTFSDERIRLMCKGYENYLNS